MSDQVTGNEAEVTQENTNLPPESQAQPPVDPSTETPAQITGEPNALRLSELERQNNLLQQSIKEWEAKSQVSPYANDFVGKINEMFTNKVDAAKISQYAALNFNDFSQKEPLDIIRMQLQYDKPRWDKDMIEGHIEETYGSINKAKYEEDENLDEYNRLVKARENRIKRDAIDAEEFLNQQKSSFELQAEEVVEQQENQKAELRSRWEPVINTIKPSDDLFKLTIDDDKSIGGKFEFNDWKPDVPDNVLDELRQTLLNNAVEAGLPLNEENLKNLGAQANQIIEFAYYKDFAKAMVVDAINSTKKSVMLGRATKQEVPEGSTSRNPAPVKKATPKYKHVPGKL